MNRRIASLLVLVVFASLSCFGLDSQRNPAAASKRSARAQASAAMKNASLPSNPPPTNIGFLTPPRNAAQGAISGIFPAVMGDFTGNGNLDAATLVNISPLTPHYSISVALNNGSGSFTTVPTATTEVQQDPLFVADLDGDGKDDILLIHPADSPGHTYVQAWISNGDGTFHAFNAGVSVTTNGFVWATVTDVNGDGCPDVVVADAATPNGNIWTLLGKGDGTCDGSLGTPTSVAFTGALSAFGTGNTTMVPGNPIVFADLNGDGFLDFAGAAASGGTAANNQIVEYLCSSGTSPCTSYAAPALLTNPGTTPVYDSCFLGSGNLGSTAAPQVDLVSANCLDGSITVYTNNGTGTFATGVYYAAGARPSAVSVADVNGDGNGDIAVTDLNSAAINVLLGNGNGTVNPATKGYVTGGSPLMPALIGHFNGASNPLGVVLPDNQTNFASLEGFGDGSFRSGINYYAQNPPGHSNGFEAEGVGLASGDFNGDGIPDFVIGNFNSVNTTGITVFLSNADGSMQPGVNYFPAPKKFSLQYVAVADFNGDGKLDIAATDNYNGVVQIFYGDGTGKFTVGPTYATDTAASPHPAGIVTTDFNGDGKPDLAFVNNFGPQNAPTSADVGVLINNGAGGFNPVVNYPLSTVATELTAADLRTSSKNLDLVVPLYGICSAGHCTTPGSAVAILLGNGDGTFAAQPDFQLVNGATTYFNPYDAAVGDLNGDGKVDLAVTIQDTNHSVQGIAVALGNGDGTFQTPTLLTSSPQNPSFAPPPLPGYVKIADMNRDGHPDLVYTNALQGTVGILYGKGDGTFYDPIDFAADRWAWDFALTDVNGDGVLDVVASGFEQSFSGVGVLLNTSASSTALQSSAPHSSAGQSITLTATITGSKVRGVTTAPTGTMTFFDGTTQLGQPATISSGAATLGVSTLAIGMHNLTAQYSGDTNYVPTTSAVLLQVVGQAASLTATPTSSANPSTLGQSITLSAKVTSTVPGDTLVPTGNVTFNEGTTALGSGALSKGVATFATSTLTAGTHNITAVYSGDTNFTASKSSAGLSQVVAASVAPNYTLTASPMSMTVSPGSAASYTVTLTPSNGYNGTVTFACPATLPTGVTCALPSPMAPPYKPAPLTINTAGPTAALIAAPEVNSHHGGSNLWASLTGVGMLGLVLAGEWKKRNRKRLGVMFLILGLAMILALVGCGGGSSGGGGGGGGGGGTPVGTYQITVSATDGGKTTAHTLNLTLVVN